MTDPSWVEENQRYLSGRLAEVRELLERHATRAPGAPGNEVASCGPSARPPSAGSDGAPFALDAVTGRFGLSSFESGLLVLCAGVELEAAFGPLCASASGDPSRPYPTFSLALAALPGAHWSAVAPVAPLRRWRLIEVVQTGSLTTGSLRIDERVLHFLAGVNHMDERLWGMVHPVPEEEDLVPSHRELAERIVATWSGTDDAPGMGTAIQLCEGDGPSRRAIAAAACGRVGMSLAALGAQSLPTDAREIDALARLWEREAALGGAVLLLECDGADTADAVREGAISGFLECLEAPVIVSGRERRRPPSRPVVTLAVRKPTMAEQLALWKRAVGIPSMNGALEPLVSQFDLGPRSISESWVQARAAVQDLGTEASTSAVVATLWDACRGQTRPRLDDLAQRIESPAEWVDLVLPESQGGVLGEILVQARNRATVYETWRFGARGARGLGISALFVGQSGTGKTLAAEVLASELRLDLYRIDLSQVVSKYIGETEKNLRRVFDAAEEGGAVLLFDEADALFGKRSEVKDSHDRYANIEVGYLLQRMESYRGLAILTTNMKEALDPAFLRRIRFVVHFPFPDRALRERIWRGVFPKEAPADGLDFEQLAGLNVAGGNIRNMAMNAAFLAADEGGLIRMSHLLRAARSEYAKMERTLTDAEVAGWA